MSTPSKLPTIPTGVDGLDDILGGGIPEASFNLIAGGPGCGKTVMAHQIMFKNATRAKPAIYFTVLGEPPLKMLRYQRQFDYFKSEKVGESIHFVHLQEKLVEQGFDAVLDSMLKRVETVKPGLVFVDSFRAVVRATSPRVDALAASDFVQQLGVHMTAWEATTFLLGEYQRSSEDNPLFTIGDAIIWLYQVEQRNSVIRKLQVIKMRGQRQVPGFHTFRITYQGLQAFPRMALPRAYDPATDRKTLSTGIPGLDEMLGGGLARGSSTLVAGPSGSGKTVLSTQFIVEGVAHDEPGIIAVFEKRPEDYLRTVPHGHQLSTLVKTKKVELFYLRPLDLSIDETLHDLQESVRQLGAKRLVIDSLMGFELSLEPTNRQDFRESLYRLVGALTALGVTVLMTVEVVDSYIDLRFSPHSVSFLTDVIILQRYVEIDARLRRVMTIVKHRISQHSKEIRAYDITARGYEVGERLVHYHGLLSGHPSQERAVEDFELSGNEARVLERLEVLGWGTLSQVADKTGLDIEIVRAAVNSLSKLNLVMAGDDATAEHFHVRRRPTGW